MDFAPDFESPLDKVVLAAQLRPVLEMLARARGITSLEIVAGLAGIRPSTFYDKLAKGNFSAVDFANIARALRVKVDVLYQSTDEIMDALRTGSFSSELSALPVSTGQGTLLDADLEPLDFFSRPQLASV